MSFGDALARKIEARLSGIEAQAVRYRRGTVTDDSPLQVALGGSGDPVDATSLATGLEVDDEVHALTWGNDMLVLGATGSIGGWVKIADFTNNTTSLNVTVPQTHSHIKVRFVLHSNRSGYQNTGTMLNVNNDTSTIYSSAGHYANTPSSAPTGYAHRANNRWYFGPIPANNRTSDNRVAAGEILIPNYRTGNIYRSYTAQSGGDDGTNVLSFSGGGMWGSNAAITALAISDDAASNLGPRARAELWACP